MSERNLYEVTGDIKDINTMLVSREESNRRTQPAQAGQVLTLDEVREAVHEVGLDWHNGWTIGDDAENRYLNLCRAIEQAVLAKRVPMTDEQVTAAFVREPIAMSRHDFTQGIRYAETHYGIVDSKPVNPEPPSESGND